MSDEQKSLETQIEEIQKKIDSLRAQIKSNQNMGMPTSHIFNELEFYTIALKVAKIRKINKGE